MEAISTNWAPSTCEAACLYSLPHPCALPRERDDISLAGEETGTEELRNLATVTKPAAEPPKATFFWAHNAESKRNVTAPHCPSRRSWRWVYFVHGYPSAHTQSTELIYKGKRGSASLVWPHLFLLGHPHSLIRPLALQTPHGKRRSLPVPVIILFSKLLLQMQGTCHPSILKFRD